MNKRLTKGLDQDQKKEFEDMLRYSPIFERLRTLLQEDIEAVKTSRRSLKSVLMQNYSEYQADRNATERSLESVLNIIKV